MKVQTSETAVLVVFAVTLIGCILAGIPILAALALGYLIFFAYTLNRGYTVRDIFGMSWKGIKTAKNILITFLLIGMLTALWRAAGTIPAIVSYCAGLMNPSVMILMAFLLNALVSVLTGTAFGTAATMGVICMTMAKAMGCNEILAGGAILSGVFFGDRCSPVSTSALLVSELTHTNIFDNIRLMVRTAYRAANFDLCLLRCLRNRISGGGSRKFVADGELFWRIPSGTDPNSSRGGDHGIITFPGTGADGDAGKYHDGTRRVPFLAAHGPVPDR